MYSIKHRGIVLSMAVVIGLLLSTAVVQAGGKNNSSFDMNDRLATEKGASGRGISKVDDGKLGFHLVAKGLDANTDYEVHVVVGEGDTFGGVDFFIFPTSSDKNGKLKFDIKGFDLGLDPGNYRLDFLVLHPGVANPQQTDFLLACQPAPRITIE